MKITLKTQYFNTVTTKTINGHTRIFDSSKVAAHKYELYVNDFPELFNIQNDKGSAESLKKEQPKK